MLARGGVTACLKTWRAHQRRGNGVSALWHGVTNLMRVVWRGVAADGAGRQRKCTGGGGMKMKRTGGIGRCFA